eukprot:TRINITY_DN27864_c0_g1_i2.p1 TRINITY_DN27864_c0_g1~~TRINITY_DN27864_c0_g1_i2.p1  ORF type:complete len:251 (-),score=27.26 TRINITY_DN27864_c0_g1_i2:291-1043(-)
MAGQKRSQSVFKKSTTWTYSERKSCSTQEKKSFRKVCLALAAILVRNIKTCRSAYQKQSGLVPIVEPEILIDGDHDITKFAQVSEQVLTTCITHLWKQNVVLEACLLKPQMIIAGADHPGGKNEPHEIAQQTIRVMKRCIPAALPGIMFLSGGQTEEEATINLNTINQLAEEDGKCPWSLSFSFGRALQASVLNIWSADQSATDAARKMALELARANGMAQVGMYKGPHPSQQKGDTLREDFRGWRSDAK